GRGALSICKEREGTGRARFTSEPAKDDVGRAARERGRRSYRREKGRGRIRHCIWIVTRAGEPNDLCGADVDAIDRVVFRGERVGASVDKRTVDILPRDPK